MNDAQPICSPNPTGTRKGPVCGAKTRAGGVCQARPYPNGRCHVHGGATPAGIASPHYKDGRRSRYLKNLPKELGAGYRAALADPELLSLREEAALLTVRIMWLLNRLKDTPPGPDYGAVWTELRDVIQDKAKVTAAEVRRLIKLQGVVTVEQALLFARALLTAAREVVTDRDQLRRLQEKALMLLPPPDGYGTERGYVQMPGDGIGTGEGHPGAGQETGHAPEPGSATPPSPGGGDSNPLADPAPTPEPGAGPRPCGLKELPPLPEGADPADYEWIPEDGEATP
jgi:hypothetical protein